MKKYIWPSLKLTFIFIILCSVLYPLFIAAVAKMAPGNGKGETLMANGKVVGYVHVGQKFTEDKYFCGRPSSVDYNASGSGGSNKAASNVEYLKQVQARIDTFLVHNPSVKKADIPAELVTASGSGLDTDLSPAGARVQVKRIASIRQLDESKIYSLLDKQTEKPVFGPAIVHVLEINIELNKLK